MDLRKGADDMEMPEIRPGMLVEHRGGLFSIVEENYKSDGTIEWIAIGINSFTTKTRSIPLNEIGLIYEFNGNLSVTKGDCGTWEWFGQKGKTKLSPDQLDIGYTLAWQRPVSKKMTHADIAEALGHDFEYVKE